MLEAPPGFEPGVELLQSSALPLGDGAGEEPKERRGPNDRRSARPATTRPERSQRRSAGGVEAASRGAGAPTI